MQKAHVNINWENYPSDATPLNEQNLNQMDNAIDLVDDRVLILDTTKFDKTEATKLIKDFTLDRATGVITITYYSGATKVIDTLLEKIAVNFDYDVEAQKLLITLDDGTVKEIDLSALITQYEFADTDTIAFRVDAEGKVSAIVVEGSINEKHLRPDYLADIRLEAAKAQASQQAAAKSEAHAKVSEERSAESASQAKLSETLAAQSEMNAAQSEKNAKLSEEKTAESQAHAAQSEANAKGSEEAAAKSEANAKASEEAALDSADNAAGKAKEAADSADLSKSYAVGGSGTREGEDTDNSRYYSEISKQYRDESEQFAQESQSILEDINKKTECTEFSVDDDGNLIYNDNCPYIFVVDQDGDLQWEVA